MFISCILRGECCAIDRVARDGEFLSGNYAVDLRLSANHVKHTSTNSLFCYSSTEILSLFIFKLVFIYLSYFLYSYYFSCLTIFLVDPQQTFIYLLFFLLFFLINKWEKEKKAILVRVSEAISRLAVQLAVDRTRSSCRNRLDQLQLVMSSLEILDEVSFL